MDSTLWGLRGLVKAFNVQFDYFWMPETGAGSVFPVTKRKSNRLYSHHPFSAEILSLILTPPPDIAVITLEGSLGLDVLQVMSRVSRFLEAQLGRF